MHYVDASGNRTAPHMYTQSSFDLACARAAPTLSRIITTLASKQSKITTTTKIVSFKSITTSQNLTAPTIYASPSVTPSLRTASIEFPYVATMLASQQIK